DSSSISRLSSRGTLLRIRQRTGEPVWRALYSDCSGGDVCGPNDGILDSLRRYRQSQRRWRGPVASIRPDHRCDASTRRQLRRYQRLPQPAMRLPGNTALHSPSSLIWPYNPANHRGPDRTACDGSISTALAPATFCRSETLIAGAVRLLGFFVTRLSGLSAMRKLSGCPAGLVLISRLVGSDGDCSRLTGKPEVMPGPKS